ncbi:MAG: hypothetical protein AVO34_02110 [Firmicutes bacterium ML8_F2]|jgi:cell division protein FtsW|nr:MAG: hypothetical protein AVO34_02110 [Firmicutes bacterium ML8_F2]
MKNHQPDYIFILVVFALIAFGLIILFSASSVISHEKLSQSNYFLKHQLFYSLPLALIFFIICQRINYRYWKKVAFPLMVVSLILLALVFVPGIGSESGAKRWIYLGFSVQPFEVVKLTFIIYLAALLSRLRKVSEASKEDNAQAIKESLAPFLLVAGIIGLLVSFQPNMSALVMTSLIAGLLYFLAGARLSYLAALSGLALAGFFVLIKVAPYRMKRLTVFLHPEWDPQGIGYQINQALLAIGSGGLFGLGFGHSIQKWKYLPEVIGDSIFAIAAEEFGLIGAGLIVSFFVILAWRGFKVAKNSSDRFGYLLAGGITGWLFFQAIINISAISGLIPLTGIPLPFISYGGTALVISSVGAGILVNISKYTK